MSGSQPGSGIWETEKEMKIASHSALTSMQEYSFQSILHAAPGPQNLIQMGDIGQGSKLKCTPRPGGKVHE